MGDRRGVVRWTLQKQLNQEEKLCSAGAPLVRRIIIRTETRVNVRNYSTEVSPLLCIKHLPYLFFLHFLQNMHRKEEGLFLLFPIPVLSTH